MTALAINPHLSTTLYTAVSNGWAYSSTNGGASWNAMKSGAPIGSNSAPVLTFAVHPVSPTVLYAGTNGRGIFRSVNNGATWTVLTSGLPLLGSPSLSPAYYVSDLAIDPQSPDTLYAATGAGVFRSVNGGSSWITYSAGLTDPICLCVSAVKLDPQDPSKVYAGLSGSGIFALVDLPARVYLPASRRD